MLCEVKSLLLLGLLSLSACAYSVHQNHLADFSPYVPKGQGRVVTAEERQLVILADFSEMELVDKTYKKLLTKCPRGQIVGISTLHTTALGFFSWTNRIRMEGLCLG